MMFLDLAEQIDQLGWKWATFSCGYSERMVSSHPEEG